ncbi:MAG TPA: SgcJ/EcaC family oxidoreductase [Blastocatellia bacterium]|nr:SgcJ/EcaC family oxidoreductase [Blastocatellia bacterium]
MRRIIALLAVMVSILGASYPTAAQQSPRAEDEAAIRAIVTRLRDAWNAGDSKAWGVLFAEDADYVIINGMRIKGREAIDSGHKQIFDTIYKGSVLAASTQSVRFIRDDVAVAHTEWHLKYRRDNAPREHKAMCTMVMTKQNGQWSVLAFHNTQIASDQK